MRQVAPGRGIEEPFDLAAEGLLRTTCLCLVGCFQTPHGLILPSDLVGARGNWRDWVGAHPGRSLPP